jgi:hypothetical protein
MSRSVLVRMRNVSEKKNCKENQNNKLFPKIVTLSDNVKNMVEPDRPQMKI